MIQTTVGAPISDGLLQNYLSYLVDRFFKILPMREDEEPTLNVYIRSLLLELLGCRSLIMAFNDDHDFLALTSTLKYLADHPECTVDDVRREVFRSIRTVKGLKRRYEQGRCDI